MREFRKVDGGFVCSRRSSNKTVKGGVRRVRRATFTDRRGVMTKMHERYLARKNADTQDSNL